jgi:hypothetical protein
MAVFAAFCLLFYALLAYVFIAGEPEFPLRDDDLHKALSLKRGTREVTSSPLLNFLPEVDLARPRQFRACGPREVGSTVFYLSLPGRQRYLNVQEKSKFY